jgi:uncharacterized protein (TIGR03067 family)
MTKRLALILVAGLLLGAAPDQSADPDDKTSDQKKMEGNWKVTSLVMNGKPAPAKEYERVKAVIKGSTLTLEGGGKDENVSFTLNPKKNPREIDMTVKGEKKKIPGIYKVDSTTLTLCFSKAGKDPRPKTFDTKDKASYTLIVFKRVKP